MPADEAAEELPSRDESGPERRCMQLRRGESRLERGGRRAGLLLCLHRPIITPLLAAEKAAIGTSRSRRRDGHERASVAGAEAPDRSDGVRREPGTPNPTMTAPLPDEGLYRATTVFVCGSMRATRSVRGSIRPRTHHSQRGLAGRARPRPLPPDACFSPVDDRADAKSDAPVHTMRRRAVFANPGVLQVAVHSAWK